MGKQECPMEKSIIYQDNRSAILLEKNRKKSSSEETQATNAQQLVVTNQVKSLNIAPCVIWQETAW